jgi:hypothetical protein
MHDTAYRIGGLVMDTYLPAKPAKILEIGALNVNGSLRDHSPRNAQYVGLDFEAGEGVDVVITGLDDWNVPDAHFDLVMASSVFEHDPFFWKTFVAMCSKTKSGGHVYVSAPSNGTVHRYPRDYWRFYPDAGLALEECGRAEGLDLTLIESFVAERETDGWNDFCAVFRVGPTEDGLNRDFVHNKIRVTNAVNWRSSIIINPLEQPEDVRLLHQARDDGHVFRLRSEALQEELDKLRGSQEDAQARFSEIKEELRNTHAAEIASWESENAELRKQIEMNISELVKKNKALEAGGVIQETQRQQIEVAVARAEDEMQKAESLATQVADLAAQNAGLEERLHERFREIAGLTRLIQERDRALDSEHERAEWLRQVASVLTRGFSTSRKARLARILPAWLSQNDQKALLHQKGLFNSEDYAAAYADVTRSGTDPLRHYINHGIKEGRSTGRRSRELKA